MRERLRELMKTEDLSQVAVALSLGISTAVISQYLAGVYKGDVAGIDRQVEGFLRLRQERRETGRRAAVFAPTSVSAKIMETARFCHVEGELGVCVGPSGLGKTTALKRYLVENSEAALIEADLGFTSSDMLREILLAIGAPSDSYSLHALMSEIQKRLAGSGRLIIIDEAEHLPWKALDLVRRINDKCDVGVLLCGLPRLVANLRNLNRDFEYIRNRIGIYAQIKPLLLKDTEAIAQAQGIANHESLGALVHALHKHCGANARVIVKVINRARNLSKINKEPIVADMIQQAAEGLRI